ncbi:hypothetical protein BGZ70_004169, partial [Mortierella alpina]
REVAKLARGEFDEQLGKITICLTSSTEATEFYTAVRKANGVLELDISMSWECTKSDLDIFRTALKSSRVSIVRALAEALKINKTLTNLDLQRNSIAYKGGQSLAEALKVNKTLRNLILAVNAIGDGGGQVLAKALKINKTLTNLNLAVNSIGHSGGQALAESLKVNNTLAKLDLTNNSIRCQGAQALAEALKITRL